MGKVVVTEFVTLDGVMQDPGGAEKARFDRGGWAFQVERGEERDRFKMDDELHLMLFPVVLGAGKKLFGDASEMAAFGLVEARQTGAVAILTLRR